MLKHFFQRLVLVLLVISGAGKAFAQGNQTILFAEINEAKAKGISFQPFQLFSITQGEKHNVLASETLLLPDLKAITRLHESKPQAVSINLNTIEGKTYKLELLRSNPFGQGTDIGYIDANGRHPFTYDMGIHYQGAIAGSQKSMAAVSIFASGEVMILFANEEGNFVTGKLEDNSGRYILYNDKDFLVVPPTACAVSDEGMARQEDEPQEGDKTTAAYMCKKVRLYWEADYELYQNKSSSTTNVQSYLTGLFNQVQTLYRIERIAVELKSMYIWTVDDAYADANSGAALSDFGNKWNAKGANYDGDLAMLLARDQGGQGGVAYVDVLCARNAAYAYGDINGTFSTVPTYSWDVSMVTHELGHNLGSRHTHWCGWNTGTGGSCGSIDNCTTQQSGSNCTTCPSTFLNSQPATAWKGTIMSYCHLVSRGISLANGFGPLPGDAIRASVSAGTCLQSIISAKLIPTAICRDFGKIELAFDTVGNFSAPNYTYQWSAGGVTTQNIFIVKPGNYTVTIKDSNGCSTNYSANVLQNPNDSCQTTGIAGIDKQYVSMYPNPAGEKVMLKFFSNKTESTLIKITDITGRTVKTEKVGIVSGENNITLNLSGVQSGMYYVLLSSTGTGYMNMKLVIE